MKTSLLAALAVLVALPVPMTAQAREPEQLPAKCRDKPVPAAFEADAFAMDGDTIGVVGIDYAVRVWGVQAAELRDKQTGQETAAGMIGRAALADILADAGQRVRIEPTKWDRYCRAVAIVSARPKQVGDTVDVAEVLLRRGVAYGFWLDDAVKDRQQLGVQYAAAEATARKARVGLWKDWLGEK